MITDSADPHVLLVRGGHRAFVVLPNSFHRFFTSYSVSMKL
jgi:hypothetical protein